MNSAKAKNITLVKDGETIFDIIDINDPMHITNYSFVQHGFALNNEGLLCIDTNIPKSNCEINSIASLAHIVNEFISKVRESYKNAWYSKNNSIEITDEQAEIVGNQVIMDFLADKYISDIPHVTCAEYARDTAKLLFKRLDDADIQFLFNIKDIPDEDNVAANIRRRIGNSCDQASEISEFRNEIEQCGISPDTFASEVSRAKRNKSKCIWDILYWNRNELIKFQYRHTLTNESRNYPCYRLVSDLIKYDMMVRSLLPSDNDSPEEYFKGTMACYFLESMRRIDFILKLSSLLLQFDVSNIHKCEFLAERFHPSILLVMESKNGTICIGERYKRYCPIWYLDTYILYSLRNNGFTVTDNIIAMWKNCHIIRAKTYELLKLHIRFSSQNYDDIKDFFQSRYDVSQYHMDEEVWGIVKKQMEQLTASKNKRPIKEERLFRDAFTSTNELFFPCKKANQTAHQIKTSHKET